MEEIWKDIHGYEGLYSISNFGQVYSVKRKKLLKLINSHHGYKRVRLYTNINEWKTFAVHRLVAQEFIPNPNNLPEVNHKDDNHSNNNVDNLEWCTIAYNNAYNKNSYIQTQELIQDAKLYSVSVFANVYIPEGLNSDSVEFILTVNGIDYSVVPINDNTSSGTKIVRYSQGNSKTEYTELTNEVITSAYLTIKLKGTKELSPYVNNIKVLFGGEI